MAYIDESLDTLEAILRDVAEELAGWRSRAQKAEAELKARGAVTKAPPPATASASSPELESENKALRLRVEGARRRVTELLQRITFLEEQGASK